MADIQGVGNLFTDPQVLSNDYRFGDGDLGPRGMALFFKTFRHTSVASAMGIPVFALSKNELKHQSKYEDDYSMSGDNSSYVEAIKELNRFEMLDLNRNRRKSVLTLPPKEIVPDEMRDTEKRSNQKNAETREDTRQSVFKSLKSKKPHLVRTKSEVDEVQQCLNLAKEDFKFDMKTFFRKESGALMAKVNRPKSLCKRASLVIRRVSDPMIIGDSTKLNLGRVHYQLAVLHGIGRFPEVVPASDLHDPLSHDVFSVLFHLCHAASLRCVPACLALGRILAGLGTSVSTLLDNTFVPVDFEAAKDLLKRALESEFPPNGPKVAAGCILYQIYVDENSAIKERIENDDGMEQPSTEQNAVSDLVLTNLLENILDLMDACEEERESNLEYKERSATGPCTFQVGDKVEGNYFLEGNYYPGVVDSISENGAVINVKYDDDGSIESLSSDNVRMVIPPTATQTEMGGPLTDEEAFGVCNDDVATMESYELRAELAHLIASAGDKTRASKLYEEAAQGAMEAGKLKTATEWSLKASELL